MKRKLVLLQIFVVIIMLCTSVYAAVDTTIGTKVSSSTIVKGDIVEVTLTLKGVNKKITNIEGYINYDKDVIEDLTFDSIVKNSENKVKIGDETLTIENANEGLSGSDVGITFTKDPIGSGAGNDTKIMINFSKGISTDSDLLTFKLKVKSDSKIGDIENAIQFTGFSVKGGDNNEDIASDLVQGITLTVKEKTNNNQNNDKKDDDKKDDNKQDDKKDDTKNNDDKQEPVGAVNNNNTNKNTNKNSSKNNTSLNASNTNTKDDTVSGKKLPATGAKVLVIPAIVLIAIAYITYNRYIRMRGI